MNVNLFENKNEQKITQMDKICVSFCGKFFLEKNKNNKKLRN